MLTTSICMAAFLGLDLDVHAGRQVELHERVQGLLGGIEDVEEPLVRADLELLARLLVDVRRAQHAVLVDLGGQRDGPRHLGARALGRVDDLAGRLVQQPVIVGLEADADLRCHLRPPYSRIFVTTPAPTVLPPSRMAKRRPSSRAIGVMSVTSRLVLSPGMTISVPSLSLASPVTSVVRM